MWSLPCCGIVEWQNEQTIQFEMKHRAQSHFGVGYNKNKISVLCIGSSGEIAHWMRT